MENLIDGRGSSNEGWVGNFGKSDKLKGKGEILGVWLWKALVLGSHETWVMHDQRFLEPVFTVQQTRLMLMRL